MAAQKEVFKLLLESRSNLFAFIYSAVRNHHAAEEIFQNVAVVVCDKAEQFQSGSNFRAWAREIARRKVLEHIRECNRGPTAIEPSDLDYLVIAFEGLEKEGTGDERLQALRTCLEKAPKQTRELFRYRYEEKLSLDNMANQIGQKSESVRKALYRGRIALRKCIEGTLSAVRHGHG